MSSTKRGKRGGESLDQFPTPKWCVHRLLEAVDLPGGLWLEPCAGAGSIIRAVNEKRSDVRWHANEIDPKYWDTLDGMPIENVRIGDAREMSMLEKFSVICTNPPFFISEELLRLYLTSHGHAVIVFLQRLNWCAGPRAHMFRDMKPSVYVLPERPSFRGHGTDSIDYGWFVFDGKGQFRILDSTPLEVRAAEKKERRADEAARAA